jgi:hypothetical protein
MAEPDLYWCRWIIAQPCNDGSNWTSFLHICLCVLVLVCRQNRLNLLDGEKRNVVARQKLMMLTHPLWRDWNCFTLLVASAAIL